MWLTLKRLGKTGGQRNYRLDDGSRKSGHGDLDTDQALSDRIDTKTETLEGYDPEQSRSPTFPEDHEGRGLTAINVKLSPADATQASPTIRKDGRPLIKMRDSQRIKKIRGELAVGCPSIHEAFHGRGLSRIEGIADCDLYAESFHAGIMQ